MKSTAVFFAALTVFVFSGCTFSRAIVNPHYEQIDTSWIVPGKTTRAEVTEKLGLPPVIPGSRGGIGKDSFRWLTNDTFTKKLEIGYIITPTFEFAKERHAHDILVRFDEKGVVELVSRTVVSGRGKDRRIIEWREAPE